MTFVNAVKSADGPADLSSVNHLPQLTIELGMLRIASMIAWISRMCEGNGRGIPYPLPHGTTLSREQLAQALQHLLQRCTHGAICELAIETESGARIGQV